MAKQRGKPQAVSGALKAAGRRGRGRGDIDWDEQPYGLMSDAEIARQLGVSQVAVLYQRTKRKIAPFDRGGANAINWDRQPLGKMPDATLAKKLGVTPGVVRLRRMQRGIPVYSPRIDWDVLPLGKMIDSKLAQWVGVSAGAVSGARLKRGIPSFARGKLPVRVNWESVPYATSSDAELARKYGVSEATIQRQRRRHGVSRTRVHGLSRAARTALERLLCVPGTPKSEMALLELVLVNAVKASPKSWSKHSSRDSSRARGVSAGSSAKR